MKVHTTNCQDTLIEVAEDCPARAGEVPPAKRSGRTAALIQFEMISRHPYKFTSDDVLFQVYAEKNGVKGAKLKEEREKFFSKGQACLRSSPLTKRYGWGVHNNEEGKVAIYPMESTEYKKFLKHADLKKVKAMRSKRK